MVKVGVYGVLRLDSGVKSFETEAKDVPELVQRVYEEAKRVRPDSCVTVKDIKGCMVVVNGKMAKPNAKLKDGDEIMLIPASGGG